MSPEEMTIHEAEKPNATRAPRWATSPFHALVDYLENLWNVLHLSLDGISMLRARPGAIEALAFGQDEDPETTSRLASAKRTADLAQREVDTNFPVLHSQFVVALWGTMESFLGTFAAQWILNRPEILNQDPWCSLKVRLGEYEQLDSEQKAQYVVELLQQSTGSPLKQGVNRFETVISILGISGKACEESDKQVIFELQQIRNVIVHKRSVADRRLCAACPWLGFAVGQQIQVTHGMCEKYHASVMSYVVELILRTSELFGDFDHRQRMQRRLLQRTRTQEIVDETRNPNEN